MLHSCSCFNLRGIMTSLQKSSLYRYESKFKKWVIRKGHSDEKIDRYLTKLLYLNTCKLSLKVPRQIMCPDEKYLLQCLDMILISARSISLHTSSLKTGISLEGLAEDIYSSGSPGCLVRRAMPTASENVNSCPSRSWIIGSISGSESMKNILNSPILCRLEDLEVDKDDPNFFENHSILCYPQKLNKFYAMSGTDMSEESSNLGSTVSHGMLQFTQTYGNLHYVFSVDEKWEVYEANLLSTNSIGNEGMQWMYSFDLQNGRLKDHVGTMKVSAHFSTCPNKSKIMETDFVLYGLEEKLKDESMCEPLSQSFRTDRGLIRKVGSTFKPSLSLKKRTKSVFWRTSSTTDSCRWSPPTEVHKSFPKQVQSYCEIASIIIKKHVNIQPKEEVVVTEPRGWGASILKKVAHYEDQNPKLQKSESSKLHSKCRNNLCSTTDIIIPAGYHSQSETRNGVPSNLIERWKSGGQCDCGGWDIGCPLRVFTTRPNKNAVFEPSGNQEDCFSFEMILKGTDSHPPQIKMVNISRGLCYLNFQSSVSALQCFAIAVAILHCKNTSLQATTIQELESQGEEVGTM